MRSAEDTPAGTADDVDFELERHRPVGPRMRSRFPVQRGYMVYNSQTRPLIEELTDAVQSLAQVIGECVPENSQQALALTALEDVQMRAMRAFEADC